jgi:MFS family permease
MSQYKHNLKTFILYGIIFGAMQNLYHPFSVKFLQRIGGTDLDISLFNAIPGLVMMFAVIPGALMVRKHIHLKASTGKMILLSRVFVLLYVGVPFLPPAFQPMSFIIITSLMNFPNAIYTSNFQAFTADLFNERERANAIAIKSKYALLSIMLVTLLSGQILGTLPQTEAQRLFVYQLFFLMSFLLGILEWYIFRSFKVVDEAKAELSPLKEAWTFIFANKAFMSFTGCSLAFHFGWQMAWPLFSIYMIKNLGADEMWISINSIAGAVAMYFSYPFWSWFIQKKGNDYVIAIATMGMAMTPILFSLSPNLYILTAMGAITGFFTSGTMTALLNGLLEVTPEKERLLAIAFYSTLTNLSLAISPMVGHYFLGNYSIFVALYVAAGFRALGSMTFFVRNRLRGHGLKGGLNE